jgi:murein DD-endopeptidase MepM/ murein hydrolase activator NlpD
MREVLVAAILGLLVFDEWSLSAAPGGPSPDAVPLVVRLERVVDLNVGRSEEVVLSDGKKARVSIECVEETTDPIRRAVRRAEVFLTVNGEHASIVSANYHLPVTIGGVQVDCPITRGPTRNSQSDAWGLEKDVRLRLWPTGSPLASPGTFGYPVKQRWFASSTQMANEPVYVDHGEDPKVRKIYYHYGLDFGGCEGLVEVVAATDGLVVSSGTAVLDGYKDTPVSPRYDVVYILDGRGWYCRYSHLQSIDPAIRPGLKVRMGQRLGLLGKEGGSGGWTHLHFDIFCRQPSGKWGCHEAYPLVWEAYQRQYHPKVLAVARPHHLVLTGQEVELDASRSWVAEGKVARYEWRFTDGGMAQGSKVRRTYARPGYYSEAVKVTDAAGRSDYDFAIVVVVDREHPDQAPHSVHVTYYPTQDLRLGNEITFKGRTFGTTDGRERWDFGDGSPAVETRSDGNVKPLAKDGYAVVRHRYERPGRYLVHCERTDRHGWTGTGCIHVEIGG